MKRIICTKASSLEGKAVEDVEISFSRNPWDASQAADMFETQEEALEQQWAEARSIVEYMQMAAPRGVLDRVGVLLMEQQVSHYRLFDGLLTTQPPNHKAPGLWRRLLASLAVSIVVIIAACATTTQQELYDQCLEENTGTLSERMNECQILSHALDGE